MDKIDIKKEFSNNLKKMLIDKQMTQKDLLTELRKIGYIINQSSVSQWCTGVRYPNDENIINAICSILKCSRSDLIPDPNEQNKQLAYSEFIKPGHKKINVLGSVQMDKPVFLTEDENCFITTSDDNEKNNVDYCLIARGDSMTGLGIKNGDLVFVKKTNQLSDGDIGIISINDKITIKRIKYDELNNTVTLISENPKYPPMVYSGKQIDHIKILGKAVFYQSLII